MAKFTNVLDHTFPALKPYFNNSFSATSLHILEKYHTPDATTAILCKDYDEIHCISRGKFSYAHLISLKEHTAKTVGNSNPIFEPQLVNTPALYRTSKQELEALESKFLPLVQELTSVLLTIAGIGYITAIATEYGDFHRQHTCFHLQVCNLNTTCLELWIRNT